MSYVDAYYDRTTEIIKVVEKDENNKHIYKEYSPNYMFYYNDNNGTYKTITGEICKKFTSISKKHLYNEIEIKKQQSIKIFESDINPIFRCLHDNYYNKPPPKLNIGFFDIETDFDSEKGFAKPDNPFSRITAISTYLTHLNKLITLVLKPDLNPNHKWYMSDDQASDICNQFDNTILCKNESELLMLFIDIIQDCDVLTGWSSKFFDIPYTINRIIRVLGKNYTKKMSRWNVLPRKRSFIRYKKEHSTYDLVGRVHLDYMDLYKKHNTQQLHSYKLDFVGEIEVGENKIPYTGTLDELYKKDFKKFIEYNRQDTMIIVKIDEKRKYISLSNNIAHSNSVLLSTTMGSVSLIEQAIVNEAWSYNLLVPDRKKQLKEIENDDEEINPVVGAYVADPVTGLHNMVGCCDINSLYPSTLRSLNMGPETLFCQIRPTYTDNFINNKLKAGCDEKHVWENIFHTIEYGHVINKTNDELILDFDDGNSLTLTAKEVYDYVFDKSNNLIISANATIFRTDKLSIISGLLAKWYAERKELQALSKKYEKLYIGIDSSIIIEKSNIMDENKEYDIELLQILKNDELIEYCKKFNLYTYNEKIISIYADEFKKLSEYYDEQQYVRKILLNSLYGALLNESCKFFDQRIGQSTTLTGRSIVRHMMCNINNSIDNEYKIDGRSIIYGDTDSCYFSAYNILKNNKEYVDLINDKQFIIDYYNSIANIVNDSFPEFMDKSFNTGLDSGSLIKAGRELIGSKSLFIVKKRYAILMFDKENNRLDTNNNPGKMKIMGLDLKRSDTPKIVQKFLENILLDVLTDHDSTDIIEKIKDFRLDFRNLNPWEKGMPKLVNGLTTYMEKLNINSKTNLPGNVRAAMNWNTLKELNNDKYSLEIVDGQKLIICYLKNNMYGFTSIAYPIDQTYLPEWFKSLPFNETLMEEKNISKKVDNLIGVLNWDLTDSFASNNFDDFFQ